MKIKNYLFKVLTYYIPTPRQERTNTVERRSNGPGTVHLSLENYLERPAKEHHKTLYGTIVILRLLITMN